MGEKTLRTALAGLALLLASCAHHRVLESPLRTISASDFWRDQSQRRNVLLEFSGKLKLSYEGKRQQISGRGRIVGHFPQDFRLELRDPIGRLHYVLTNKGSRLAAYYPREHQAFRDSQGGKPYFQRILGLGFSFSDLVAFYSGVLPARWDKAKFADWEWDAQKGGYRGTLSQGGERLTLWVDSGHAGIQLAVWESNGQTVEARYLEFETCCESKVGGFQLAREVQVKIPKEQTKVEVSWELLTKPKQQIPDSAFEYTPVVGDKVVELK